MSTPLPNPPPPPRPASVKAGPDGGATAGEPAGSPGPPALAHRPARRRQEVTAYRNIVRARIVAFGGLIALIGAVAFIVLSTTGASPAPSLAPVAARVSSHHPRYWTVRPGQTLSSIAARERTSVVALEHVNPHLIPGALISGQRVLLPG